MTSDGGNEWGGYIDQPDDDTVVQPGPEQAQPTQPIPPSKPPKPPKQPKQPGGGPAWMRGPWWRIAIAVVGIAAIAVGVIEIVSSGKKHHTTTTTTSGQTTISKASFITQADAICGKWNPQIANDYHTYELDYESGNTSGASTAALAFEHDAQTELDDLKVLPPPSEGASTINHLLTDDQQEIADYESGPPNSEGAQAASALGTQDQPIFSSFGFKVCGLS
jgi:hypothetical protein